MTARSAVPGERARAGCGAADMWEPVRRLDRELIDLEWEHLERITPLALVRVCAVTLVGAVVAVPGSFVVFQGSAPWWARLSGAVVYAGAVAVGWRQVRVSIARFGPVGGAHREATRRRDAAIAAAWAALPHSASGTVPERERAGMDEVFRQVAQVDARADETPSLRRVLTWGCVAVPVIGAFALTFFVGVVGPLVGGRHAPASMVGLPSTCAWAMVARIVFLKAGAGPVRVTRTRKRAWKRELAFRAAPMRDCGIRAWRLPDFHTRRLWQLLAPGRPAPQDVLWAMPDDANVVRRWYWRHVGPGTTRAVLVLMFAFALATVSR